MVATPRAAMEERSRTSKPRGSPVMGWRASTAIPVRTLAWERGGELGGFESKQVVAEVFTGMCDLWRAGGGFKQLYAQHGLDGNGAGSICPKG